MVRCMLNRLRDTEVLLTLLSQVLVQFMQQANGNNLASLGFMAVAEIGVNRGAGQLLRHVSLHQFPRILPD